ncbi:Y-family DNA polymerase [Agarivorans sp. Z349TD_8]|uniref:Y-family DNA polymerase n=1 Tax=Agarivorans sp. Z349TD_8 TaxID=3421434 RepID=UPI003D7C5437
MYWIYLDFPQLALDLLQREHSPSEALAIHHKQQLTQFNKAAHQLGLYFGCSLNTAYQLAPQLHLYEQQTQVTDDLFQNLAQQALSYAAQVALHPDHGLFINGSGMQSIYPTPQTHAQQLSIIYQQQGLSFRLAWANTALAARWLVCSKHKQAPYRGVETLDALPLSACDLPKAQIASLQAMGLYTFKQLCALPRPELRKRLGEQSLKSLDQARGKQPYPLAFIQAQDRYQQMFPLLSEINTTQALMFPLKQACQHLQHWLRERQYCCNEIVLELCFRDKAKQRLLLRSARMLQSRHDWFALFQLKLETLRLPAALLEFNLSSEALYPLNHSSNGLFDQDQTQLDDLLFDQLNIRLGSQRIHRLSCRADYRPELASQYQPLEHASALNYPSNFPRPCWLLPQLKPINIVHYELLSAPERIASGWWDEHQINRDYYLAKSQHEALAWICQENKQWFLHGWFG